MSNADKWIGRSGNICQVISTVILVGQVVNAYVSNARQPTTVPQGWWWTALRQLWLPLSLLVLAGVLHVIAALIKRTAVEFCPTRESAGGLNLIFDDPEVEELWIMTPSATNIRGGNFYKKLGRNKRRKLQRLVILPPNGNAIDGFATVERDRSKSDLKDEIKTTVNTLMGQSPDLDVKYLDAPFNGTIIANPNGDNGWVQFELFYPYSSSEKRSLIRIHKSRHPERFKEIVEAYEKAWRDSVDAKQVSSLTNEP